MGHANKLFEKLQYFEMHFERVYNGVNSRRANWKIFSWELWQIRGVGSCLPACPTYLEFIKSLSQIGKDS